MQPFTTHTGRAVVVRRSNIDTDQIIPSDYLKRVSRTGFADGLFAAWRPDPDFALNAPGADRSSVLVVGPEFGIGSSREHAVWALQEWGFRAVISARFADIFRSNSLKNGLLPVQLPEQEIQQLMGAVERDPDLPVTVDLDSREVRWGAPHAVVVPFALDDYTRWRLREGLDDIDLTLRHREDIAAFEATRPRWMPVTASG